MTDMAAPTQPRPIPGSNALQPPATNLAIPKSVQSLRPNYGLSVDTSSPVTQNGSYEFDRIIKSGEVLKRTRKTKSWKPIYIVLRPNLLSIYRNSSESKLRHQINLSDLTAVARQKDPKRKGKHVFGLFSPSRNFHLEANTDSDAQDWVERIRDAARMDEHEEEISLASPGGAQSTYKGFERSRRISPQAALASDDRSGGYSSSDAEAFGPSSYTLPKRRDRNNRTPSARRPSQIEYSGAEGYGSYSDFSDSLGPTAPMSALSLSTDSRPATSSAQQHTSPTSNEVHSVYGPVPKRPMASQQRNPSQLSTNQVPPDSTAKPPAPQDSERVVYHNWILLLRPKHGVRQWKKVWMVVRPKALALYKNEDEYRPLLILPFETIIDAVEIDPISKSKEYCLQVISEERNYRFCAVDEESLNRWLGAFKSVLSRRRAASKDYGTVAGAS